MKKNLLTKAISICLSVFMMLSFPIEIFAYEQINNNITYAIEDHFGSLALEIIDNPNVYEVESTDFSDIEILNEVDIKDINVQSIYSLNESEDDYEVTNLPVVINGKIELILSLINTDEGYNATLGKDFAPLLNEVQLNGDNEVSILQDGFMLYAITPGKIYKQIGNEVIEVTEEKESQHVLSGTTLSTNIVKTSYNIFDINTKNDGYTQAALESLSTEEKKANSSIQPYSNPVKSKQLNNYPIVGQKIGNTSYGMCWAATVASMVRFEGKSSSLTAQQVCNKMDIGYNDGGTLNDAKSALETYLGSPYLPTIVQDTLSTSEIETVINNVDPAYMSCKNGSSGHAVALVGYNFSGTSKSVRIMDPAYECFKTCTRSFLKWTFPFGNTSYTWKYTVRLFYTA